MTFDPLASLKSPAALIEAFSAAVAREDFPVAEALARTLVRDVVAAIRGVDRAALEALGTAIQSFTKGDIDAAQAKAPRLAARIEHLLPVITEALDLDAPSAESLLRASLGTAQQLALVTLDRAGGELARSALATQEGIDPRNLTRVLGALEAVGLVERLRAPGARAVDVQLTPAGRRVASGLAVHRRQRAVANGPAVDTTLFAVAP